MKSTEITREEMWAKQHLSANEIDYAIWEQDKVVLQQMSQISRSCSFVVDVYKYRYAFASSNFADILGYDSRKIATLEKQGDYLESRFHPDDFARLEQLQINLSKFIYSLPHEQRCQTTVHTGNQPATGFRTKPQRKSMADTWKYRDCAQSDRNRSGGMHCIESQKWRNVLAYFSIYSTDSSDTA